MKNPFCQSYCPSLPGYARAAADLCKPAVVPQLERRSDKSILLVQSLRSSVTPLRHHGSTLSALSRGPGEEMLHKDRSEPASLMAFSNTHKSNVSLVAAKVISDVTNGFLIQL